MEMPPRQIFQVNDTPLKFFLQKDIPDTERVIIEKTILDEGGTIVEKVPIRGYVVIQPDTSEAERLQEEWRDETRPERFFVPCAWVHLSKERGLPFPQVFVKDAYPVQIHIHRTIANLVTRRELTDKILFHGGDPNASYEDATVIIASKDTEAFKQMRKELQGNEEKFVENMKWIDICIEQQFYRHTPNSVRNPGGRRAGDERTPFTEEDEANLCNWIASVIPFKESGGRTGNKIYIELVARAGQPGYEWVERHTWQSWRERYKKNSERLDQHIAAIVNVGQANGTIPQDRAQFGYFKLTEGRQTQTRRDTRRGKEREETAEDGHSSREGAGDGIETQDPEWPIREGNDTAPNWAKRHASTDIETNSGERKKQKTGDATFRTFVLAPATEGLPGPPAFATATEFAADFGQQGPLDPVEQEIQAIARNQRFLPDEVWAYYQRNGDLLATRQRFERVRALIDNLP